MSKASYYYKYNFISPESLYAKVKEELKSYFQTGVVDDLLFPTYTEDCLKKLGRSSYKIEQNIFKLEDFEAKLPDNFEAVRELWLVTPHDQTYKMPNSVYEQSTIRVDSNREIAGANNFCAPEEIKVTYKTNGSIIQKFNCHHLLKPGNINAKDHCSLDSWNSISDSMETFDIRGKKLLTNFPEGTLFMVYYVKDYDDNQYQLIPDNIRIRDYIENYLKYKCFETVYNNISDETLKQVEGKMVYYERKAAECKVLAETEIMKQTVQKQIMSAKSARNRFNKYLIS